MATGTITCHEVKGLEEPNGYSSCHENIKNTLIYIDLEHAIFKTADDELTCRITKTPQESAPQ